MMPAFQKNERVLLIIAPSMHDCCKTAKHWGFTLGQIENFRNITRAHHLRGVRTGTPFITFDRENWGDSREAFDLDQALTSLQRQGKVRIAQEDDIAAHTSYAGVPFRTGTAQGLATVRESITRRAERPF